MARPREFDEDDALDAALDLFWRRGFEGTSIHDLVEATGVGRASLYATFGDKKQLFARVIDRYVERARRVLEALEGEGAVLDAIERVMLDGLKLATDREGPRGCFLLLAGTQANSEEDAWVREQFVASLLTREELLTKAIKRGQRDGEIDKTLDAGDAARFLSVVQQGLASNARGGIGRARLESTVRHAVRSLRSRK